MTFYLLLGFAIAFLAISFAWQNPGQIDVKFFGSQFQGSVALFCLLIFACGFLVGYLLTMAGTIKKSWKIRNQQKKIDDLEEELQLREQKPILDVKEHDDHIH